MRMIPSFNKEYDKMAMKSFYEHQQQQHEDLIQTLTQIPTQFHSLPFHYWGTETLLYNLFLMKLEICYGISD